MRKISEQKSKFVFCCSKDDQPVNLVMLQAPQNMLQILYSGPKQTMFIFIRSADIRENDAIRQVQAAFKTHIFIKQSINQLRLDLQQNRTSENVVVIYPPEIHLQMAKLKQSQKKIGTIICFTVDEKFETQFEIGYLIKGDKHVLLQWLQELNSPAKSEKELPNFLFLMTEQDSQVNVSHHLVQIIRAMLSQNISSQIQSLIVDQVQKLVLMIEQISDIYKIQKSQTRKFLEELRKGMSAESSIRWYTRQSIVFHLINNLLRATRNAAEAFYLQPYFKVLFNAILMVHKLQIHKYSGKTFTVFRGGQMAQLEAQKFRLNQRKFVQNLSFLSTSTNKKIAQSFSKNVLFEIEVDADKIGQGSNGFAQISKFSEFYGEQEILFNPLNSFYIQSVTEQSGKWLVKLKYGLSESLTDQSLHKEDGKLFESLKEYQARIKQKQVFQGSCLKSNQYFAIKIQKGFDEYWHKFLLVLQDGILLREENDQKRILRAIALYELSHFYISKLMYKQAIQSSQKCFDTRKMVFGHDHQETVNALQVLSLSYFQSKLFLQQIQLLEKYLEESKKIHLSIFGFLREAYRQIRRFTQSNKILSKIFKIISKDNQSFQSSDKKIQFQQRVLHQLYENKKSTLKKTKLIFGEQSDSYLCQLACLADLCQSIGHYQEQIKLSQQYVRLLQRFYNPTESQYYEKYFKQAVCKMFQSCFRNGLIEKGLYWLFKYLKILKKMSGTQDGVCLHYFGFYEEMSQRVDTAVKYYKESIRYFEQNNLTSEYYYHSLSNLGKICVQLGKIKKGVRLQKKALTFFQNSSKENYSVWINKLIVLGEAYIDQGLLKQSKMTLKKAIKSSKFYFISRKNYLLQKSLYTLGRVYEIRGLIRPSCKLYIQSLILSEKGIGIHSIQYYHSLFRLVKMLTLKGHTYLAKKLLLRLIQIYGIAVKQSQKGIKSDFQNMFALINLFQRVANLQASITVYKSILHIQLSQLKAKGISQILCVLKRLAVIYLQKGMLKKSIQLMMLSQKLSSRHNQCKQIGHSYEMSFFEFVIKNNDKILYQAKLRQMVKLICRDLQVFIESPNKQQTNPVFLFKYFIQKFTIGLKAQKKRWQVRRFAFGTQKKELKKEQKRQKRMMRIEKAYKREKLVLSKVNSLNFLKFDSFC